MCDKMFVALANFYEPKEHPEWFQEILDEGTNSEEAIIQMYLEKGGLEVTNQQRELNWEVMDGVVIRCHTDGEEADGLGLFEAKKIRQTQWEKFKRVGVEYGKTYPMQVAAMMFAGDYEWCSFTGGKYNMETGEIDEVFTHHLASPPVPKLAILKRISHLEKIIDEGLQPQDVPCNVKQYPCPVFYLHDEEEYAKDTVRLKGDDTWATLQTEFQTIAAEQTVLNRRTKELAERKKQLIEGLTGWLEGHEVEAEQPAEVDGVKVSWKIAKRAGYTVKDSESKQVVFDKKGKGK